MTQHEIWRRAMEHWEDGVPLGGIHRIMTEEIELTDDESDDLFNRLMEVGYETWTTR